MDKLHPWDKKTYTKKELFFPFDLLKTQTQESEASMMHSPVSSYFISGQTRSDEVTTAAESRCIWDRLGIPEQNAAKTSLPEPGRGSSIFISIWFLLFWLNAPGSSIIRRGMFGAAELEPWFWYHRPLGTRLCLWFARHLQVSIKQEKSKTPGSCGDLRLLHCLHSQASPSLSVYTML